MESKLTNGMLLSHYGYFHCRAGQWAKGRELIRSAYDLLCGLNAEEECARVGMLMVEFVSTDDKEESEKHLRKSLAVFEKLILPRLITRAQLHLGNHLRYWGEFDKAGMIYQETYRDCVNDQDDVGAALSLFGLGGVADFQANYTFAQKKYEEAISLFREVDIIPMVGVLNKYLGNVHLVQKAYKAAEKYFKNYLELNQETGIVWRVVDAERGLARVAIARVDFDSAQYYLNRGMKHALAIGNPSILGHIYCYLGQLSFRQGDYQGAARQFLDALRESPKEGNQSGLGLLVMALAAPLLARSGEITRAIEMAALALYHPGKLEPYIQHEARNALENLNTQAPEAEFNAAVARGSVKGNEPAKLELIKSLNKLSI